MMTMMINRQREEAGCPIFGAASSRLRWAIFAAEKIPTLLDPPTPLGCPILSAPARRVGCPSTHRQTPTEAEGHGFSDAKTRKPVKGGRARPGAPYMAVSSPCVGIRATREPLCIQPQPHQKRKGTASAVPKSSRAERATALPKARLSSFHGP
jgi:hypothetical protein